MAAELAEIVVGGRWDEPTQANARSERLDCSETVGLDEVDVDGVRVVEMVGSGAVDVGSRLRKTGKEVGYRL